MRDLFPLAKTGVSTRPIQDAAEAFLAALAPEQRARALFPLESDAWRRWSNIHPFIMRHGVCLDELTPGQRQRALAVVEASLSAPGFRTARDVMRLNDLVRHITGNAEEYGEWLYWLSVMGQPSADEPWGWQLDGHHLIVNGFVLGDQVVLTPMFMGSEPVAADTGPYAGTRVFQAEEEEGLALIRALTPAQRARTVLAQELPGEAFTAAFRDNLALRYEGIRFGDLSGVQQSQLVRLVEVYVGRIREGHDRIRMDEVTRHLGDMHFAWMGGFDAESVVLLPAAQPGHSHRVRPPARDRLRQRPAVPPPHPHRGAHAERQRLRQGSPAPAPRAVRSRAGRPRACARARACVGPR